MNKLFSYTCKGVFLAFFVLACIACAAPSVKKTPKQTETTSTDVKDEPKQTETMPTDDKDVPKMAVIELKQDITNIPVGAFKDNNITEFVLPDMVRSVGKEAFKGNPLKKLTLSQDIDMIQVGKDAFATSEETLTVVLKKELSADMIDAQKLAHIFGKKTVRFEVDPSISGETQTALEAHVATLNTEATKILALLTVSFYDGEALITQTHVTANTPVSMPEPDVLPSKTGQRIESWYEALDLSGDEFDFENINIDADKSLYAKWGSAPTVKSIAFTSHTQKIYKANETIQVTVTFTEAVNVNTESGTPKVVLKIGTKDRDAVYQSASTPTTLVFAYTVVQDDEDEDGIEILQNKLDANSGTIKKVASEEIDAVLLHERVHKLTMIVDTTAPRVQDIEFTSIANIYTEGEIIAVTITFSEVVVVIGRPKVVLKIGTEDREAFYLGGTNTKKLVFAYTVVADDTDEDGIEIAENTLDVNEGSIKDVAGHSATLMHNSVPVDAARTVDAILPKIEDIAFTSHTQKIYKAGETIQVTVTFTEAVDVNTESGTPKVVLKIGTEDRDAVYQSASTPKKLVFAYTVVQDDEDANGIEILQNKLDANSGTIKKVSSEEIDAVLLHERVHEPTMIVDTTAPRVQDIEFTSIANIYTEGEIIAVTITFSEVVVVIGRPKVVLKIGTKDREAFYLGGTGTKKLVFAYTVAANDTDEDGIEIAENTLDVNEGSIKDVAGHSATLMHNSVPIDAARTVDAIIPKINNIAFTSDYDENPYKVGDVIQVTVGFSEVVTVTNNPKVVIKIGNADKEAIYTSGSGETALRFEYTVAEGDEDNDGIEIDAGSIDLDGGTITDKADNPAILTYDIVSVDGGARKVDAILPIIEKIAFTSAEKVYKVGETIQVAVDFSEVVIVTGTPKVAIKIGSADREASYTSNSSGTTLRFEYTVAEGDEDDNGIEIDAGSIDLDGGTITDRADNPATLTHSGIATDDKRTVDTSVYNFAFETKEHKQALTEDTYTYVVTETTVRDPANRTITYTSSNDAIATVNNTGTVTFVTAGIVVITATKNTSGAHKQITDSYTLYITMKPTDKPRLVEEIKRAVRLYGNEVNLNYIDTSAITDMSDLFSSSNGLRAFNGKISRWDVSEVTTMSGMFSNNTKFNQDISPWWDRLGKVTDMSSMFDSATVFNSDISRWQVGSVTTMHSMFRGATAFNQNISGWDIRQVTDMRYMFLGAKSFKYNLYFWGSKLNPVIKVNSNRTFWMFSQSGLTSSRPSWWLEIHP